jgi:hypothetical protein
MSSVTINQIPTVDIDGELYIKWPEAQGGVNFILATKENKDRYLKEVQVTKNTPLVGRDPITQAHPMVTMPRTSQTQGSEPMVAGLQPAGRPVAQVMTAPNGSQFLVPVEETPEARARRWEAEKRAKWLQVRGAQWSMEHGNVPFNEAAARQEDAKWEVDRKARWALEHPEIPFNIKKAEEEDFFLEYLSGDTKGDDRMNFVRGFGMAEESLIPNFFRDENGESHSADKHAFWRKDAEEVREFKRKFAVVKAAWDSGQLKMSQRPGDSKEDREFLPFVEYPDPEEISLKYLCEFEFELGKNDVLRKFYEGDLVTIVQRKTRKYIGYVEDCYRLLEEQQSKDCCVIL